MKKVCSRPRFCLHRRSPETNVQLENLKFASISLNLSLVSLVQFFFGNFGQFGQFGVSQQMHHSSTSSHCLLPEKMCFCSALLWGMKSLSYQLNLFNVKGVISKQGHVYLVEEAGFNSPSSKSRRWSPSSIEIPRNL